MVCLREYKPIKETVLVEDSFFEPVNQWLLFMQKLSINVNLADDNMLSFSRLPDLTNILNIEKDNTITQFKDNKMMVSATKFQIV